MLRTHWFVWPSHVSGEAAVCVHKGDFAFWTGACGDVVVLCTAISIPQPQFSVNLFVMFDLPDRSSLILSMIFV